MQDSFPASVGESVVKAMNDGRREHGIAVLDAWQATTSMTLDNLSWIRYLRRFLNQPDESIKASQAMILLRQNDEFGKMCDHLRLAEDLLKVGDPEKAWNAISVVFKWPDFPRWLQAGMARTAVKLAFRVSTSKSTSTMLARRAYETAVDLLDEGCSVSIEILTLASACSLQFGRDDLATRFTVELEQERKRYGS